jgi:hypothetical protein
MKTRGVCELTLESTDHHALAKFYKDVLDLPSPPLLRERVLGCLETKVGVMDRFGLSPMRRSRSGSCGGRRYRASNRPAECSLGSGCGTARSAVALLRSVGR